MSYLLASDLSGNYPSLVSSTFQELLGQTIRQLRKQRRFAQQAKLATAITQQRQRRNRDARTVSVDTISRIEQGGNATTSMLAEIVEALGLFVTDTGFRSATHRLRFRPRRWKESSRSVRRIG